MESAGGSCREPAPRRHGLAFRRGGPYPPASFSLRLAAPPFPPLSATGCRGSRRSGWPRGRALRAAPCGALPKCAPRRRRAGTGGRCCRPWNADEMRRTADTARDSLCAEDRRSHSSPRACRSCAPARPASPPGSTVQGAPTAHRQIARQTSPRLFLSLPVRRVHIANQSLRAIPEAVNHPLTPTARSFWVRLLQPRVFRAITTIFLRKADRNVRRLFMVGYQRHPKKLYKHRAFGLGAISGGKFRENPDLRPLWTGSRPQIHYLTARY